MLCVFYFVVKIVFLVFVFLMRFIYCILPRLISLVKIIDYCVIWYGGCSQTCYVFGASVRVRSFVHDQVDSVAHAKDPHLLLWQERSAGFSSKIYFT